MYSRVPGTGSAPCGRPAQRADGPGCGLARYASAVALPATDHLVHAAEVIERHIAEGGDLDVMQVDCRIGSRPVRGRANIDCTKKVSSVRERTFRTPWMDGSDSSPWPDVHRVAWSWRRDPWRRWPARRPRDRHPPAPDRGTSGAGGWQASTLATTASTSRADGSSPKKKAARSAGWPRWCSMGI